MSVAYAETNETGSSKTIDGSAYTLPCELRSLKARQADSERGHPKGEYVCGKTNAGAARITPT